MEKKTLNDWIIKWAVKLTPVFMTVLFSASTHPKSALRRWVAEAGSIGPYSLHHLFNYAYGMFFIILLVAILLKAWDVGSHFTNPKRKSPYIVEVCDAYLIGMLLSIICIFVFSLLSHYFRFDRWLANPHF